LEKRLKKKEETKQERFTFDKFTDDLKNGKYKKIAVLTGAGISVSAGIPDFRSPGSGIYSKLAHLGLPFPEAVFMLNHFKEHPEAFYLLAKELDLDQFNPTPTHYFLKLLEEKGLLMLNMTQNIDGLEFKANISPNLVVQAHGSTIGSHCTVCTKDVDHELMKIHIKKGEVMFCKDCKGPCKPKIVFFGEPLPVDFFKRSKELDNADLIIIMGTSLAVAPFNMLVHLGKTSTRRVLINREEAGSFDFKAGSRDLFLQGDCDEVVMKIAKECGWVNELDSLIGHKDKSSL